MVFFHLYEPTHCLVDITPETLSQTILVALDTTRTGARLPIIFISSKRPALTSRTQRKLSSKLSTLSPAWAISCFAE